ncbi:hypothetical protein D3C86_1637910 [compost metagenome]
MLVVLVLIAYLFRTIISFTNTRTIDSLFKNELIWEVKHSLEYQLRVSYSKEIFSRLANEMGAVEYNIVEVFDDDNFFDAEVHFVDEEEVFRQAEMLYVLHDLNTVDVSNFIKKRVKEGKVYFEELSLGESIKNPDSFIWAKTKENSIEDKRFLRQSVVLSRRKSKAGSVLGARKFFEEKLEERLDKDKSKGLDDILDAYYEIYKLQIEAERNGK